MAKNNEVKVGLNIDDNGSLKETGRKSKKAAKDMKGMTDNTRSADRAMKGLSKQSSNASKNFSKMSQGLTGGIVPAYATLAANIFALGAAFRFLKEAGDYRLLLEGQTAFAATTGVAYKTLSNIIMDATDGQIRYADAAQAAAIGIAAGVTPDQLRELGEAAKLVSIALGRDVTDSFNRLIRGTTKAEPELLDELGIILRLEPALKAYAAVLDKSKESLTQFEKTQAVTVDVLGQVEQKFGAIAEIMTPETNKLNKMAKSFDDLTNSIKLLIAGPAEWLATFFANNVLASAGALLLLGTPILRSVIPAWDEFNAKSMATMDRHNAALEDAKKRAKDYSKVLNTEGQKAQSNYSKNLQKTQGLASKYKGKMGGAGMASLQAGGDVSPAQLKYLRKSLKDQTGAFSTMSKTMQGKWKKMLDAMHRDQKIFNKQYKANLKKMGFDFDIFAAKVRVGWEKTMHGMQVAVRGFVKGLNIAMSAISYLSVAFLLYDMAKQGLNWLQGYGAQANTAESEIARLLRTQRELTGELEKMGEGRSALNNTQAGFDTMVQHLGSMVTNAMLDTNFAAYQKAKKELDEMDVGEGGRRIKHLSGQPNQPLSFFEYEIDNKRGYQQVPGGTANMTDLEKQYMARAAEIVSIEKKTIENINYLRKGLKTGGEDTGEGSLYHALGGLITGDGGLTDDPSKVLLDFVLPVKEAGAAVDGLTKSQAKWKETLQGTFPAASKQLTFLAELKARYELSEQALNNSNLDVRGRAEAVKRRNRLKGMYEGEQAWYTGTLDRKDSSDRLKTQSENMRGSLIGGTAFGKKLLEINKAKEVGLKLDQAKADLLKLERQWESLTTDKQRQAWFEQHGQLTENIDLLGKQKKSLESNIDPLHQIGEAAVLNIETGLQSAIMGVLDGTKSMKEGFLDMAKAVLAAIAQIIAKLIAMKAIEMGAKMFGFGFADGGVIPMAKGGIKPRGYSKGGIATQPTYLVGEGQYNEAVVPLPDGRSIPVQMHGGGNTANVVVNVSADGQAASNMSANGGEQAAQLGRAISAAVQEELHKQQRNGGILSPYGNPGG